MQNAYLVFDIGTGNTRVALVGEDGAILDIAKENTRMYTDPIASRAQYFKPQEWQDAVFSLIRGLLAAHPPNGGHTDATILYFFRRPHYSTGKGSVNCAEVPILYSF